MRRSLAIGALRVGNGVLAPVSPRISGRPDTIWGPTPQRFPNARWPGDTASVALLCNVRQLPLRAWALTVNGNLPCAPDENSQLVADFPQSLLLGYSRCPQERLQGKVNASVVAPVSRQTVCSSPIRPPGYLRFRPSSFKGGRLHCEILSSPPICRKSVFRVPREIVGPGRLGADSELIWIFSVRGARRRSGIAGVSRVAPRCRETEPGIPLARPGIPAEGGRLNPPLQFGRLAPQIRYSSSRRSVSEKRHCGADSNKNATQAFPLETWAPELIGSRRYLR